MVIFFCSSPASATIGLMVDPGGYSPLVLLSKRGRSSLFLSSSYCLTDIPSTNQLGSKEGVLTKLITEPSVTSISAITPLVSPKRDSAFICKSISILR